MLIANDLCKTYNSNIIDAQVIKGINLVIENGEYVTISGKSGSGKTTLLYLLCGLETPSSGNVSYNDIVLNQLSDKEISNIRKNQFGFIFQFYNLVKCLNVYDNIFLPLEFHKKKDASKYNKTMEYISLLGIEDKLKLYPGQLSGGQQQRVAIARALAINPDIIFADEPTGNLDSATGHEVLEIFDMLNKVLKKTIILVTHDESISKTYETRNIYIEDGLIK